MELNFSITRKKGMATYLVIVLIAFIALSLSNLSILSQGEVNQLTKSEALLKADLATRSLYQKYVWRLKSAPFELRPCTPKPYSEVVAGYEGFNCELLSYDSEDEDQAVDIWITAKSANAVKTVFYRVKYIESLINKYNKVVPLYSANYPVEDFPTSAASPKTPQKILKTLKDQNLNLKNKIAIIKSIEGESSINKILQKINSPEAGNAINAIAPLNSQSNLFASVPAYNSQLGQLLTVNSLKKTDVAIQLAQVTQAAGNSQAIDSPGNPANIGANTVQNQQPGNSDPQAVIEQPNAGGNGNAGGGQINNGNNAGGSGQQQPGPNQQAVKPAKVSYAQRFNAWANSLSANLKFGFKRALGKATAEDQAAANAATQSYLNVTAHPNGIMATGAKLYNSIINQNYQKYNSR